ncbi:MAG TPA: DUF4191 domain-containing protein [Streptosporangiaceae bacterium]|jgi:hypothetical protein|nr:DUF4191 domain-containing protein [Streptosporangiaceae bacterium]
MAKKSPETTPAAGGAPDPASMGRIKQLRMAAGMIRQANPKAMPIVLGAGLGTLAVLVVVGVLTGLYFLIALGVLLGLLVAMILFGRFAQSAQYSAIEGQPGAAAAVLQTMRGNWTVTPAIAANRNMDVVHRAVGRPGVILVGEGSVTRLPSLLAAEKKRVARVAYDIPIYDIVVGDGEGQVPIRRLQRHIMRLPRNLRGSAVSDLNYRLKALPQTLQAPKGPMPARGRQPKMPRPKIR